MNKNINNRFNSMKQEYWVYIVDNYQRDLPALAWWIFNGDLHQGHKICLLPMGDINASFMISKKPDVIVWNYARSNNINAIKVASLLNIYNIIHDTEGIPYHMDKYFSNISNSDFQYIDEIWCWGNYQAQTITNRISNLKKYPLIKITGSIRYEYAKSLPKGNLTSNMMEMLWCTNYAIISPKYQSVWKEFNEYFNTYKLMQREKSLETFLEFSANRQSALEYIISLLSSNDKIMIRIRPHPFESSESYDKKLINNYENVDYSRYSNVQDDLNNCCLILNSGCQTSLDAFIRGIPSLRLNKEEINIWSKVTPYINKEALSSKISTEFLNELLLKQDSLFRNNNISLYLFNLERAISIKSKNISSKKVKRKPHLYHMKRTINLFYIYIKVIIKYKILKKSKDKKSLRLSSEDIHEYLQEHYQHKHWSYKINCILFP